MMKSIISSHEAPMEQVIQRMKDVINCGMLVQERQIVNTVVERYMLGDLNYYVTRVNGIIVTFELYHVYCFKF